MPSPEVEVRAAQRSDGAHMWRIASESELLEVNTVYAYLLLATHFAATCRVAVVAGSPVGYVAGYRLPDRPEVIFVWQIGVDAARRGEGIARRLLVDLLDAESRRGATHLETTVTPSNQASRRLFASAGRAFGAEVSVEPMFSATDFIVSEIRPETEGTLTPEPADAALNHEPEELLRIGPLQPKSDT